MNFRKDILLKNHTTFRIGGLAKYFFIAKTKEDLISAIKTAQKNKLPFFVLGGGSNLLVSDKGYKGLVIKIQNSPKENIRFLTGQAKLKIIYVGSGVKLNDLVNFSLDKSLAGLEWAVGIPGTIGGAIYGNAEAFGNSISDIVKEIEVFDIKTQKIKKISKKNCQFGYKDSIFKHRKNLVILSSSIKLKKGNKKEIKKRIAEFISQKKEKQPLNLLSAGCIFKNFTPYRKEFSGAGPKKFEELDKFKKTGMIPAGYLIDKCGLKGKKIGKAKISEKHANFIVNLDGAEARDVKKLINLIKQRVKNKFRIILEEEICFLN